MNKVEFEMPRSEVIRLLGEPDDVRTEYDPGGIVAFDTVEILRYGTDGHLTPATLGQVCIDAQEKVSAVYGSGEPPPDGMFEEAELRRLLRALAEVPSYDGRRYNPQKVVRAVNVLQPIGKKRALAAIAEYLRIVPRFLDERPGGMFLVLRTLFEIPDSVGAMPPMRVGMYSPEPPKDAGRPTRYPGVIEDDIPFLVVSGYMLMGQAEHPSKHLPFFEANGVIRSEPLRPSGVPFAAVDRVLDKHPWLWGDGEMDWTLRDQVFEMLDSVFRPEREELHWLAPAIRQVKRAEMLREALALDFEWDPEGNDYVFADRSALPPRERKIYRRIIWRPDIPDGAELEVIVERESARTIEVRMEQRYTRDGVLPATKIRLLEVVEGSQLAEFKVGGVDALAGSSVSHSEGHVDFPEGNELRMEMVCGDEVMAGPIEKP